MDKKAESSSIDHLTKGQKRAKNILDTLLNTNDYLVLGDDRANIEVVHKDQLPNYPTFKILIEYRSDVIIGEHLTDANLKIYRKYNPITTFEDYPVEIYEGDLSNPDFSTNPDAKMFITRIKKECAKGINFAGHYTLVIWGCGSACQSGVVVDRISGKIYGGYGSSLGSNFKKNSRMLIRNIGAIDTITNLIETCSYCDINHLIWTGSEFKEIE